MTTSSFRLDRLKQIAAMEQDHFWFLGKRMILRSILDSHLNKNNLLIADIGCGTGNTIKEMLPHARLAIGLDTHIYGLIRQKQSIKQSIVFVQSDAQSIPLADNCMDAVLLLDVLEHVDDRAALKELFRIIRPGGVIIASVPAFQWLWSFRDIDAGHLRRYCSRSVRRVFSGSGFHIFDLVYYQFLLFPFVAVSRLIGRRSKLHRDIEDRSSPWLNRIFGAVNALEIKGTVSGRRYPWGTTLFIVARKLFPKNNHD